MTEARGLSFNWHKRLEMKIYLNRIEYILNLTGDISLFEKVSAEELDLPSRIS